MQSIAYRVGCATGEEAYPLAMLCAEIATGMVDAPKVPIFATDIDENRIRREVREMVLFANHSVGKDLPFSQLDLVTCPNLLIYLNDAAMERVMETQRFNPIPLDFGRPLSDITHRLEYGGAIERACTRSSGKSRRWTASISR